MAFTDIITHMKKYYLSTLITAALIALPAFAAAQMMDVEGATGIGATLDGGPGAQTNINIRNELQQKIQNDVKAYNERMRDIKENVRNNQDGRNMMLQGRPGFASSTMMGSTTRAALLREKGEDGDERGDDLRGGMMGSTTMMGRFKEYEDDAHRMMRFEVFHAKKEFIARQFDVALRNLANIRGRANDRITKAQQEGKDMSSAIALLAAADAKISAATAAVSALKAYLPNASTTATASTTVNLDTARGLADAARGSIKDAQKALNDVIVAIAHALGYKLGDDRDRNATSTASTTTQ